MNGLTDKEVNESRSKYGSNKIIPDKKDGFLKLFIESLGDPIIKILLIALAIKVIFLFKSFDWYETIGIVIAIFLASFISSISEYGSEKAFLKLQEESSKIKVKVKRNGKTKLVNIDDIVVNDIVLLETGDRIPADGKIINGIIRVDESMLNGEMKEKEKTTISDYNLYRGTVVYSGNANMVVTKVGSNTYYGKIAKELQEKQPESPLKIRLRGLAKFISKIGYVSAFLVSLSYLFSVVVINNNFEMNKILETITNFPLMFGYVLYALTLTVTVIVVAVPEGLPMMITLVLSSNMKRMLKNNVLVRKMIGIETAGSINILFTDKTGTLTKGKLEVVKFITGTLNEYNNEFELSNYKIHDIVKTSIIYNSESTKENGKIIGGNITDRAILNFIKSDYKLTHSKIKKVPFNSAKKYSITQIDNGRKFNLIKGAYEKIINNCRTCYSLDGKVVTLLNKDRLNKMIDNYTKMGIRVLALATSNNIEVESMNNLTLVGIVLIKDEIREEAKEGIQLVKNAHINTVMITGDNKDTATTIAKEIGLIEQDSLVITSEELNKMSDSDVKNIIPRLKVVARSLPQDKSRLVKICQEMNLVVGMTGDGVNDAPALKKADVGFSMGSGTEVSKEASDIVIMDDNFLSISKAILYGRTIFKSIRKFIIFQLTVNICAVSLSIIGPFIGVDTPITVIQMLWVNMVMDTLAGFAFSFEPPLKEYMYELPKKKDEPIINRYMLDEIMFTGLYSAILCIIFLKSHFLHSYFRMNDNNIYIMTAFFGLFIFIGIFNAFNARTHRLNLFSNLFKNKVFLAIIFMIIIIQIYLMYYGGNIFRTTGLTFKEFNIMILLSMTVIPIDFMRKIYLRWCGNIGGV